MDPTVLFQRYQKLQQYVGWTEQDAQRVQSQAARLEPFLDSLIDDFYAEIERHPEASKVISGGHEQINRLKKTLLNWLHDLLAGPYDRDYVARRWRVGWRHVEIGLDQVYTNVALSRLRNGLLRSLEKAWTGDLANLLETRLSLNTLLDLDLAMIEDAYQTEYAARKQRTERLATIGQVAGGVAHELRNPLNVVKTSVYFLLHARNPTPAKTTEHLERIERHVVLADGVITALSNFAKQALPNVQPFPVVNCIQEALEINPVAGHVHVTIACPDDLPPVLADIDQIRIVFGNLIRNANEAMSQGGELNITGRRVENGVEVSFKDSGTGISQEQLGQIMEPLYSTKAKGLGLGLAIARTMVDKNKGQMRVESELQRGSSFTVKLVAAAD